MAEIHEIFVCEQNPLFCSAFEELFVGCDAQFVGSGWKKMNHESNKRDLSLLC